MNRGRYWLGATRALEGRSRSVCARRRVFKSPNGETGGLRAELGRRGDLLPFRGVVPVELPNRCCEGLLLRGVDLPDDRAVPSPPPVGPALLLRDDDLPPPPVGISSSSSLPRSVLRPERCCCCAFGVRLL